MRFGGRNAVQDIENKAYEKWYEIGDHKVRVCMQNAMTGMVNGERVLLDDAPVNHMIEKIVAAVQQNCTKYNPIPDEIILRNYLVEEKEGQKDGQQSDESQQLKEEKKIIESYEPRFSLAQVALNEKVKDKIRTAIAAVSHKKKMIEDWGMEEYFAGNRAIVLNFYGKPGTGKSMTAEAVAKELGKRVYHINYSELESKYVGETPKNIRKAFECATRDDAVLIFDEADSFLGKRLTSVTQSADYGVNITRSVLLMELEKFCGVVIFTTNLISNYDEAFKRRIFLNVYFEMPDEGAREQIWSLHLSEKMPLHNEVTAIKLAKRYEQVSGADIKDMVFYAALHTLENKKETMDFSVFDDAYETMKGRYQDANEQEE